jgi:hypothetical protein
MEFAVFSRNGGRKVAEKLYAIFFTDTIIFYSSRLMFQSMPANDSDKLSTSEQHQLRSLPDNKYFNP